MNYPLISEYEREIKTKGSVILRLPHQYNFVPNKIKPIKIYSYGSGAMAGVFKVEGMGKQYALRVFLNGGNPQNINRVMDIAKHLGDISSDFLCKYQLYQNGIVIKDHPFPVILMEWVNGKKLNEYVDTILHQNDKISELQFHLVKLNESMEKNQMAHGDIQSGNVLVEEKGGAGIQLKLVDYDAMFLPELSGQKAIEIGHSSFQHPKRDKSVYNAEMDRFSFWLILTALEAIKFDKNLWSKDINLGFNDGDNFLFRAKDLQNPNVSPLVKKLRNINQPSLNFYLDKLLSDSHSPKRNEVALFDKNSNVVVFYTAEKKPVSASLEPSSPATPVENLSAPIDDTVFSIDSDPSNATVYCDGMVLGVTPISLNVGQYSNKKIALSYGSNRKSFYLNSAQKVYKVKLIEEVKTYTNSISPYGKEYTPKQEQKEESSSSNDVWKWFIIGFVGLLLLILFIQHKKKEESYDYSYMAPIEADSSAAVFADSDVAAAVDSVAQVVEEVKEEQVDDVIEYLKDEKLIDPIEAAIADRPRFRSVEAQRYAEEYAFYCRAALKAYREKDLAKLEEFVEKQQQLILFVSEDLERMPKQDAKAWVEWVGKVSDAVNAE
jgi:putative membrane protein